MKSTNRTEAGDEQLERAVSPSGGAGDDSVSTKPTEMKDESQLTPAEKHAKLYTEGPESRQTAVNRFNALMLPTLIDVYSASVSIHIRSRAVSALLKIVNFAKPDVLAKITKVNCDHVYIHVSYLTYS